MKRILLFMVLFILCVCVVLFVTGCRTYLADISFSNDTPFGEHTRTPVKDFITMGLVFTEVQFTPVAGKEEETKGFTYQSLLKEANDIGADAIINVIIDRRVMTTDTLLGENKTEIWYGSALAVKYTDILKQTTVTVTTTDGGSTTTETTSVYFNDNVIENTAASANRWQKYQVTR